MFFHYGMQPEKIVIEVRAKDGSFVGKVSLKDSFLSQFAPSLSQLMFRSTPFLGQSAPCLSQFMYESKHVGQFAVRGLHRKGSSSLLFSSLELSDTTI